MRRGTTSLIALALVLSACGQADDSGDSSTTTATPTTTTTAAPVTTTTAAPTTTTTTTTAAPVDEGSLQFDFSVVRGIEDPIIDDGSGDDWDAKFAFAPNVVFDGSTFHMFYTGWAGNGEIGIGYATSIDGVEFEQHPDNPVLRLLPDDITVEAGRGVARIREDGTWEMFVGEWVDTKTQGTRIWHATASDPAGPWMIGETPIHEGTVGTWETRIVPQSISPDGTVLYYDGARLSDLRFGALLLQDDGSWRSYDDPATDDATDPVFQPDPEANLWDSGNVASPLVFATDSGFEALYAGFWKGKTSKDKWAWLGYATSSDGIEWDRYQANPAVELTSETGWLWLSAVKVDGVYYLYYAISAGSDGIGLITGSIAER